MKTSEWIKMETDRTMDEAGLDQNSDMDRAKVLIAVIVAFLDEKYPEICEFFCRTVPDGHKCPLHQ